MKRITIELLLALGCLDFVIAGGLIARGDGVTGVLVSAIGLVSVRVAIMGLRP